MLPALYAMVALTVIPAFHCLLTSERAEFFRSVVAVVTFTSNFFFYFQTGYFDHAAVEKPLLHTWSLAVEEQFYLALPVLLFGVMRWARGSRIALPVTLGAMTLTSFVFSISPMRSDAAANAFFMSPPRAWEFLIGSIAALPGVPLLRHVLARSAARALALLLLAIGVFGLRKESPFPGPNALLPCIGAALFIWAGIGVPTRLRGRTSPFNAVKFFGQISYSLYPWHSPLLTFARFSKASLTLGAGDKVALFALTVAISYLSWRHVEQPFRVLPDIFDLDQKMRSALADSEQFSYLSVLDAACPARQCPLMLDGGVPIAWDHAHLTTEGSAYVMAKLVPKLGLEVP